MDITQLQRVIVDALEDVKAQDIRVFSTTHLTGLFDRVVVAAGTSNRQTKALASSVREKVKEAGGEIISTEGEETGEWVLVDCGDAVVHIMQPALRQYYNLEEIWGDKPVKIKLSASGPMAARRAEETDANRDAEPVAKPRAKAPARKVAAKTTAKPAAKTARKPAAAKPAVPGTKAGAKALAAKPAAKPAAKRAPARKPPAAE
jgi:ribosome-associated protein